jgi:hypothetical protein
MKASEARKITESKIPNVERIYDLIKIAAEKGKNEVFIFEDLTEKEKRKFVDDGYSVVTDNTHLPITVIQISW